MQECVDSSYADSTSKFTSIVFRSTVTQALADRASSTALAPSTDVVLLYGESRGDTGTIVSTQPVCALSRCLYVH